MMKTKKTAVMNSITRFGLALVVGLLVLAGNVFAQTPAAGTLIGNQATATFNDAGGNPRTVTSNVVNTEVDQIAALTLTASQTKTTSAGGSLTFPHTINNSGNGVDQFTLSSTQSGDFAFGTVVFYEDLDGNGVPDNFNPITTTPNIPVGLSYNFVAVVTVPSGALDAETAAIVVTATSVFDNGVFTTNTDTATVTDNAVINVTKSMSSNSGAPGSGPYTVTLTYTNSGNNTATALAINDALPTHMDYAAGTGRWSVTGATALTDGSGVEGASPNITFEYVSGTRTVSAVIASIAPGQSGTITFQVGIAAIATPGPLNNTAAYDYNDGASAVGPFNSNTFVFTVTSSPGVTGTGEVVANAPQGASVNFTNVITNTGTITDSYNITIVANSFPAGSSYILYKPDGVSPFLDTNGDGTPDTGPMAPGATYNVILKVTLPNGVNGGGAYIITKRATSITSPGTFDEMDDELTTITTNTVDITADVTVATALAADGLGAGEEASPVRTVAVNPGAIASFVLQVNNTTTVSDNYDIEVSTDPTFATKVVPAGVTVTFKDGVGGVITNTGTVNSGAAREVNVEISIPLGRAATSTPEKYYVRSKSPATGASDKITLGVTVNSIRSVVLASNNSGQVFPGGTVTYVHTVTNNGNTIENATGAELVLNITDSNVSFSSVIFLDVNGDGLIDGGDVLVNGSTNLGVLNPGSSIKLIVRVNSTLGVTEGLVNTSTISATITGDINSVGPPTITSITDLTTVINSNVTLAKKQALDADNDGVPDAGAGVFVSTQINAKPGEGILYQIIVSNLGTTTVTSVNVNDAIPAYTTYNAAQAAVATTKGTASYSAGTTSITAVIGSLAGGETATITFGVLIDN